MLGFALVFENRAMVSKRKLSESVRAIVPSIPCGMVSTYGGVAEMAGHRALAGRSVGNVLNRESIN